MRPHRSGPVAAAIAAAAVTCTAAAAPPVSVALVGRPPAALEVGRVWTARLVVRPASARGPVVVTGSRGARRLSVRATGRAGSYRARLSFPLAGRWALAARAGGRTSRLGSVRVVARAPEPLTFRSPGSVELEPAGTLLLVESGRHRLHRVDPATGELELVAGNGDVGAAGDGGPASAAALGQPFGLARAPGGEIYVSSGDRIRGISTDGTISTVAVRPTSVGPMTVAPDGALWFATREGVFSIPRAGGEPRLVTADVNSPHGLAAASDGTIVMGDTDADRVVRVGRDGAIAPLAEAASPLGVDVAADGTVYVAESRRNRVVRVAADGTITPLGEGALRAPSDVEIAPDGTLWVVESGESGRLRRIAPGGRVTTVTRAPTVPAMLSNAADVAVEPSGSLLVADLGNRIVRARPGGAAGTVAGTGAAGYFTERTFPRVRRFDPRTGAVTTAVGR